MQATDEITDHHDMPDDVLLEVLSRLPVKSVLRFKSVCKHWQAVMSSPTFVAAHLENSKKRPTVLLLPSRHLLTSTISTRLHRRKAAVDRADDVPLDFALPDDDETALHGVSHFTHCDGLLAFADAGFVNVYNLATRECTTLPVYGGSDGRFSRKVGLCFDRRTATYKVVIPFQRWKPMPDGCLKNYLTRVEIVALAPEARRVTLTDPPDNNITDSSCIVSVDGAVYWTLAHAGRGTTNKALLCLDVSEAKFEFVAAPRPYVGSMAKISEVRGKLCFSFYNNDEGTREMWLLMTRDRSNPTWTKLASVAWAHHLFGLAFSCGPHGPVLLAYSWHLYSCDVREGFVKKIVDNMDELVRSDPIVDQALTARGCAKPSITSWTAISFAESLVPIRHLPVLDSKE